MQFCFICFNAAGRNATGPGGLLAKAARRGPDELLDNNGRRYCGAWLAASACSRASLALRRAASPRRTTRAI